MENIELYLSAETQCEKETLSALNDAINLNNEIFEFYLKISYKYCQGIPKNFERPISVIMLNHKILKSIRCLSILLNKGHYADFHSI
jgi:hypothetical protein